MFCAACGLWCRAISLESQDSLAKGLQAALPPAVISLFDQADYAGAGLQSLPDSGTMKVPTANEISLNYPFILPVVKMFSSKAAGGC